MREIQTDLISKKISAALKEINYFIPQDLSFALQQAAETESTVLAKNTVNKILENAQIAAKEKIPLCQDTGLVEFFIELGQDVHLTGKNLQEAVDEAIQKAYLEMRKSIVADPLIRKNTETNSPGIIYTNVVPGENIKIQIMAKGAGSENKSALKMFNPTAEAEEIEQFVLQTVTAADASACPPYVIGIGIGGSFDYCPVLAKKALLRPIGSINKNNYYKNFEQKLLTEINKLGIGPAGYGGKNTALAVHIETHPCHIASLPVAVCMQCHVSRHQEIII